MGKKAISIEDVRDQCRSGRFRPYTQGRDIYLEDTGTGRTVWLTERTEATGIPADEAVKNFARAAKEAAIASGIPAAAFVGDEMGKYTPEAAAAAAARAGRRRETPHGGRAARMFGTEQKPQERRHDDEGPYKGFLLVKCEECGAVRAFCAKRETYGFRCKECGQTTALDHMRPLYMKCKCGEEFRYKTNITDEQITHTCIVCGAPVDMELNARGTAYVTVGERSAR